MGQRCLFLLGLLALFTVSNLHPVSRPNNGLQTCRKNFSIVALEVLPGGGWDNLRNVDMGRVMNFSYSQCQTTEDGVYLIPDEVFVIPQKVSGVEMNSEIISSWLQQKSTVSKSVNADASFLSMINGKFSTENQRMKTHQVKGNSVTARTQVRNHLYTVKSYPDFTLDSRFARQAEEIADAIENNQTRRADYLSEKMVLDYGTHVITSVEAGATLVQEDYIRLSAVSDAQSSHSSASLSASSGENFFKKIKFDISSNVSEETSEARAYKSNITYSIMLSHGGALFYPGITLQKWQESTLNNLVAIDRSGLPLHYFLNPSVFPDLPRSTVNKLALSVKQAIQRYYEINKHPGCVNPDSKNFNFQANWDDASCEGPSTNLSFGGVYQTCSPNPTTHDDLFCQLWKICTPTSPDDNPICKEHAEKNPATGEYSCQQPYTAILLRSEIQERPYSTQICQKKCHHRYIFFKHCEDECETVYHAWRAEIRTFWCATNVAAPEFSGYLFGGLYGPSLQNPLTKSSSCPPNFFAQQFLSGGMMVCLSNDYEAATRFSVPFGGFFSCESNNMLAGGQSRCPPQFSQHLAAISDGCQVLYCVQSGIFTGGELLPVHLPPFTRPPVVSTLATNTVAVLTEGEQTWVRIKDTKMWKIAKPEDIGRISQAFAASSQPDGRTVGAGVGVTVAAVLIVAVAVFVVKRRRKILAARRGGGYEDMESSEQNEIRVESQSVSQTESQTETQVLLA